MTTIDEMMNAHFDFMEEQKRKELLLKSEFEGIDLSDFDFEEPSKYPLINNFIYQLIQKSYKTIKNPEVESYLDIIYLDKEKIIELAEWLNESNSFKKTFRYYEFYSKVVEEELSNDKRSIITPQRVWSLLTSQLYEKYMYASFIKYIKKIQSTI